jgi:hypothetical protein
MRLDRQFFRSFSHYLRLRTFLEETNPASSTPASPAPPPNSSFEPAQPAPEPRNPKPEPAICNDEPTERAGD